MKILGIMAVDVVRESRKFCRAHCAVIFAIAQLSCFSFFFIFRTLPFIVNKDVCKFYSRY